MKKLLKVFTVLIILFSAIFSFPAIAAEGDKFIQINSEELYLYSSQALTGKKFIIPKTYYVKHIESGTGFHKVSFGGVEGYISSLAGTPVSISSTVTNPSADLSVLKFVTKDVAPVFSTPTAEDIDTTGFPELNALTQYDYLGTYKDNSGKTWLYIKNGSIYGYVKSENTNFTSVPAYTLPALPTPVSTSSPSAPTNSGSSPGNASNDLVRILLIIGICIPAVIIVYLLFRPAPTEDNRYTIDIERRHNDNDDYR